jgi:hypothetical protein
MFLKKTKKESKVTFGNCVVVLAAAEDAYDGNGDDNDG